VNGFNLIFQVNSSIEIFIVGSIFGERALLGQKPDKADSHIETNIQTSKLLGKAGGGNKVFPGNQLFGAADVARRISLRGFLEFIR
jgi:hypothetical protein